jgi:hypothetical protein
VPAPREPDPSIGRRFSSSRLRQIMRCSSVSVSTLIPAEFARQASQRAPRSPFLSAPTSR